MCFSKLSALQCFLHSLHCTSRLRSGHHSLPHGFSPITTVRSKHNQNSVLLQILEIWGAQKSRSFWFGFTMTILRKNNGGTFRWGHFFLWLFKDVSTRWQPEANGATCSDGAVDVSQNKKGFQDLQCPTHLDQPSMTWWFLFFWKTVVNLKSHVWKQHFGTCGAILSGSYKNMHEELLSKIYCWLCQCLKQLTACESAWAPILEVVSRITHFMFEGNSTF